MSAAGKDYLPRPFPKIGKRQIMASPSLLRCSPISYSAGLGEYHVNQTIPFLVVGGLLFTMDTGCSRAVEGVKHEGSALRFKMKTLQGEEVNLAKYEGQVVIIVNVASKCGYTPQYKQLQQLHEKYSQRGLAILGFPCNQFLWQEPGSEKEIGEFCRVNYGVTFDMFAKVCVKGENACDLYKFLTSLDTKPKGPGKIGWNFEKFIVNRRGEVVARFGASTKPDASEVVEIVERELAKVAGADLEPGKNSPTAR
jgi:glutathione peroxidase